MGISIDFHTRASKKNSCNLARFVPWTCTVPPFLFLEIQSDSVVSFSPICVQIYDHFWRDLTAATADGNKNRKCSFNDWLSDRPIDRSAAKNFGPCVPNVRARASRSRVAITPNLERSSSEEKEFETVLLCLRYTEASYRHSPRLHRVLGVEAKGVSGTNRDMKRARWNNVPLARSIIHLLVPSFCQSSVSPAMPHVSLTKQFSRILFRVVTRTKKAYNRVHLKNEWQRFFFVQANHLHRYFSWFDLLLPFVR